MKQKTFEKILRALDTPLNAIYLNMEAGEAEDVHCKTAKVVQNLITQTQQETLEWCERELEKLKEKDKGWTGFGVLAVRMGNYEQIQASKDYGYNSAIEDLTKTIKQRKEGK